MQTVREEVIVKLKAGLKVAGKSDVEAAALAAEALGEAEVHVAQAMQAQPKRSFTVLPSALADVETWARDVLAVR